MPCRPFVHGSFAGLAASPLQPGEWGFCSPPKAVDDEGDEDDAINAALDFTAIAGESIKALEPDGELAVSIEDLDAYIAADGLWAEEY